MRAYTLMAMSLYFFPKMADLSKITRKSQMAKLKYGNPGFNYDKSKNGNFGTQNHVLQKNRVDKRSLCKRGDLVSETIRKNGKLKIKVNKLNPLNLEA